MSSNGLLQLAWQADRAAKPKLRDIMITLAVAESDANDAWADRFRAKLVRERPGHFYGPFPGVAEAMASPEVRKAVGRLREKYPLPGVDWLLLAGNASRGRFTGKSIPLPALLQDLLGPGAEAEVRRDQPEPIRGPVVRSKNAVAASVGSFSAAHTVFDASPSLSSGEVPIRLELPSIEDESLSGFYLSVLFSIALLLSMTQGKPAVVKRAG